MPAPKEDLVAALLQPVDAAAPAGPNLEYDAEFLALERAAAPKAERSIGDSVKAAEEPDWEKVAEMAQALLGRSKDLRVAVHLVTAWLRTAAFPGWGAGLALVRGLLEGFWPTVHPQLDADDDDDPTYRVNSVAPLATAEGVLRYLRTTPFASSPRVGRASLRDLRIANGTLKMTAVAGEDGTAPAAPMTLATIEACCMDCPLEQLAATVAAVVAAADHAKAMDAVFNERIGTAGPDFKPLLGDLAELRKYLGPMLARRTPKTAAADDGFADDDAPASTVGAAAPTTISGATVTGSTGPIAGPQDVVKRLEELCNYYARLEPSSPVPLLLRRAQRLVGRDFLDLLKDLAPGGIKELQVISGTTTGAAAAPAAVSAGPTSAPAAAPAPAAASDDDFE